MQIHKLMITNLLNTHGLTKYTRVRYRLDKYNTTYTKKSREVYSRKDGDTYYISENKIDNLLENLEKEISDFETAKNNFVNASSSLMSTLPGSGASNANAIQWWVRMNDAVNASSGTNRTSQLKKASENMLKAYSKVLAIKECELEEDVSNDWEIKFDELTDKVESLHKKYLITTGEIAELQSRGETVPSNNTDPYIKAVSKLEEISAANQNNINSSNLRVNVNGQNLSIDQALAYIQNDLTTIRTDLQSLVDTLDTAIGGNGWDIKSLDKLADLAQEYNTCFLAWEASANQNDTSMKEDDKKSIEGKWTGEESKLNLDRSATKINDDSVKELKTRLVNIRSQLKTVISGIDSLKYGGTQIKNISSYSSFESRGKRKVSASNIPLTNQELQSYADSTFNELFKPAGSPVLTIEHMNDPAYNLEIDPVTKKVQTPELFVYMHYQFDGSLDNPDIQKNQDEIDAGKADSDNTQTESRDKGRYHGNGEDIAKDFSGSETFNLADGVTSGVMDLIDSLVNLDITSIRDDMYVTTYMMDTFSYATYEEERLYQLIENKTELRLPQSGYRPTQYEPYLNSENTEKNELFTDLTKSLTNKMVNSSNNVAYGAEIEYILYGGREGKGNADNVKAVYSNIYGIRYVLNLVSGFANFWSSGKNTTATAINTVATIIQSVTSGIIPAPVTKVVLIPILTAFETAKDMDRLEAGFPVELYKSTDKQWWVKVPEGKTLSSISELTSIFKGSFNGPNTDEGIFYSDYLTIFVYLGLKSSSAESMYQRMAELMQANMRRLTGKTDYSMKNCRLYFQLKAEIRVKPLMITLPFFNGYSNNLTTQTDWCTYQIDTIRGYS